MINVNMMFFLIVYIASNIFVYFGITRDVKEIEKAYKSDSLVPILFLPATLMILRFYRLKIKEYEVENEVHN